MNYIVKKCFLYLFLVSAVSLCSYASAFAGFWATAAGGQYTQIEGPNNPSLKIYREFATDQSAGLHLVGDARHDQYLYADLELKSHCQENFRATIIDITTSYQTKKVTITDPNRTETFSVQRLKLEKVDNIRTACSNASNNPTINYTVPVSTHLSCWEADSFLSGATDIANQDDELNFEIRVTCQDVLDVLSPGLAYASVSQGLWQYTCHTTPQDDEAFWQKYRFVVEGTDSHQVQTNGPIGSPRCVRRDQSDLSNMGKVAWSADE